MIEISDLRRELAKIRADAGGKKGDPAKARQHFEALSQAVLEDIEKTGDARVRGLLRTLREFVL